MCVTLQSDISAGLLAITHELFGKSVISHDAACAEHTILPNRLAVLLQVQLFAVRAMKEPNARSTQEGNYNCYEMLRFSGSRGVQQSWSITLAEGGRHTIHNQQSKSQVNVSKVTGNTIA